MRKFYFKIALAFALLMSASSAWAEDGVIVLLKNGTTLGFAFKEKPVIVTSKELEISTPSRRSISLDYGRVQRVYWGDVTALSIEAPQQDEQKEQVVFRILDNGIEAIGLEKGERVEVFNVAGMKLASAVSNTSGGTLQLTLPLTQSQVFIIHTSKGTSYKFIKK